LDETLLTHRAFASGVVEQLLQVYWLSKLFRKDQSNLEQRKYMPYYVLGNVMIGTCSFIPSSLSPIGWLVQLTHSSFPL
jgi:hypothetical protein